MRSSIAVSFDDGKYGMIISFADSEAFREVLENLNYYCRRAKEEEKYII